MEMKITFAPPKIHFCIVWIKHTRTHTHTHKYIYIYVYIYVCVYIYIYIYIYIYTHTEGYKSRYTVTRVIQTIDVYLLLHPSVYVCVCVYIYIYIYIYIQYILHLSHSETKFKTYCNCQSVHFPVFMSNTSPVTAHEHTLISSVSTSTVIVTLELSCAQCLGLCEADVFQYAHFAVTKQMTWYCTITVAISVMYEYIHGLCQSSFYTVLKSFRDFIKCSIAKRNEFVSLFCQ